MDTNRIHLLISKLTELLNNKGAKTALDADLMLDYLRVIYADVLELRKDWHDNIPDTFFNQVHSNIISEKQHSTSPEKVSEIHLDSQPLQATSESKNSYNEVEEIEKLATPNEENLEKKQGSSISNDIYFERPKSNFVDADNKNLNKNVEEKIDVIDTQSETAGMEHVAMPKSLGKKDIRKLIGLNDRYLYLNELFNNDKFDYESALDYINGLSDKVEAVNWLNTQYIDNNNWQKDDETVNNFYATVSKYFSNFI